MMGLAGGCGRQTWSLPPEKVHQWVFNYNCVKSNEETRLIQEWPQPSLDDQRKFKI